MKISVRIKDVKIKINDENTESFNRYDTRVDFVIKIIKSMSDEATKLLNEPKT